MYMPVEGTMLEPWVHCANPDVVKSLANLRTGRKPLRLGKEDAGSSGRIHRKIFMILLVLSLLVKKVKGRLFYSYIVIYSGTHHPSTPGMV